MSIRVRCECGKTVQLEDEHAGKRVKCLRCGAAVVVPAPAPPLTESSAVGGKPEVGTNTARPGRSAAERLDDLERENSALKKSMEVRTWAGASCLGLVVISGLLLTASTGTNRRTEVLSSVPAGLPPIIEAEGFVVKDHAGKVRATLGRTGHTTDDRHAETGLQLWTDGKQRGAMVVDGHGWGVLTFSNASENTRLELVGEGDDAGLTMYDQKGDMRLGLNLHEDGGTNFHLYGKNLDPRVQFGVRGGGQELPFFDVFDAKEVTHPFIGKDGLPLVGGETR